MPKSEYAFLTRWRVDGAVEDVFTILEDAPSLVRLWPSVYLDVRELAPGDGQGVNKIISLCTKGWLPYILRWQFRVTESHTPNGFTLEAWGDFVGQGIWKFAQDGKQVDITYDWRIRADKPLLRYLSFLMKPVFAANHRWTMAMGKKACA